MIGPEEYNRIFLKTILVQFFKDLSRPGIHGGDDLVVPFPVLSSDGIVWIVWREGSQILRFLTLLWLEIPRYTSILVIVCNAGFVAPIVIEDAEERLFGIPAIAPVSFFTRSTPCVGWCLELVVLFAVICAIITVSLKINRKWHYLRRQLGIAAHVVGSNGRLIHSCDDTAAARGTDPGGGESVGVKDALAG